MEAETMKEMEEKVKTAREREADKHAPHLKAVKDGDKDAKPHPKIWKASELLAEDFPPAKYIVEKVLPQGATLLAGKSKIGKSWLSLGLARAVASGGIALGNLRVESPGDVLYLALEDGPRRMQNRMKHLLSLDVPGDLLPERLDISCAGWPHVITRNGKLGKGYDQIREWLDAAPAPRLVIVDVLQAAVETSGIGDLNDYGFASGCLSHFTRLADEYEISVIVVHHTNKRDATADVFDAILGSTGLIGAADQALVLTRQRGGDGGALHAAGRDLVGGDFELALNFDRGVWINKGDLEEVEQSSRFQTILEILRTNDGTADRRDIVAGAVAEGISENHVDKILYDMQKAGKIIKPSRGKYTLPDNNTHSPWGNE